MNILFLNHYLPFPLDNGGHIANSSIIEMIAKKASVDLVILGKEIYPEENVAAARDHYLRFCRSFRYQYTPFVRPSYNIVNIVWHYLTGVPHRGDWSQKCISILSETVSKLKTDIIWAGSTYAGKYLQVGESMNCKLVLTAHNIESDIFKQQIINGKKLDRIRRWLHWRDVVRLEGQVMKLANVVTTLSENDSNYIRKFKSKNDVFTIPNTLPQKFIDKYKKLDNSRSHYDVSFIGSMDWPPNEDAACYLIHDVMPLVWKSNPNVNVYLIGKNPSKRVLKLASRNIIVTGRVKSVDDYLAKTKVVVAPMRLGSGIKIKVLEAMAAGKAIVTTSMGAHGTGLQHGLHALVADQPSEIAQAILLLLKNEEIRSFLGESARNLLLSGLDKGREVVERILNQLEFEKNNLQIKSDQ
jgi:glycosyltransferase involved in cell wall biosynthesis